MSLDDEKNQTKEMILKSWYFVALEVTVVLMILLSFYIFKNDNFNNSIKRLNQFSNSSGIKYRRFGQNAEAGYNGGGQHSSRNKPSVENK